MTGLDISAPFSVATRLKTHAGTCIISQIRPVGSLKAFHRRRAGMGGMRRLIFKDEKMHKARRIVLLLPCLIKFCAGLIGADIGDELRDRALWNGSRVFSIEPCRRWRSID